MERRKFEKLIVILQREVNLLENLIVNETEKTGMITQNNIAGIEKLTDKTELLCDRLSSLEFERDKATIEITGKKTDIKDVLKIAPDDFKHIIKDLNKTIIENIEKLKKINDINTILLEDNLKMISIILGKINKGSVSYDEDGKLIFNDKSIFAFHV